MKIKDRLDDHTRKKLKRFGNHKRHKKTNKSNTNEFLSERDLKELMGMNRDRYERRRGAMRRK